MRQYTKEELITALCEIRDRGFIACSRENNHGSVGNTLEDLLGIEENNLPLPNASEWELKTQRKYTSALITLFHMEPSPTAMSLVPRQLLPLYGWPHARAGQPNFSVNEKSFRQTINTTIRSSRGFKVIMDEIEQKVVISFDSASVTPIHHAWLEAVEQRVQLGELNPQPYWGFSDLVHKAGTKLLNCFFVIATVRRQTYHYQQIKMLRGFSSDKFLDGIRQGAIYIDFDARTGHNHGTKFRTRQSFLPHLYDEVIEI